MSEALTRSEMVVLAGAIREMMKADGSVSHAEVETAVAVADKLALPAEEWDAIWEEAARKLPTAEAVKAGAAELYRQEAREVVYEILHEVATHDEIVDSEWDLLEWLDETWRFSDDQKGS
ncbi:MAG: TerB family tellurite resistance protein [Deltaproteobacteria bacterium]|nr:TerB family tellurite resistance protein [Deltaproteobacteria bacterium]